MEEEKQSGPQEPGVIKATAAIVSHPPLPWHRSHEMAALLLIQIGIPSFPEHIIPGKELSSAICTGGNFLRNCFD